jgi:hypothetical protein
VATPITGVAAKAAEQIKTSAAESFTGS